MNSCGGRTLCVCVCVCGCTCLFIGCVCLSPEISERLRLRPSSISQFYPNPLAPSPKGQWLNSTPTKWDAPPRTTLSYREHNVCCNLEIFGSCSHRFRRYSGKYLIALCVSGNNSSLFARPFYLYKNLNKNRQQESKRERTNRRGGAKWVGQGVRWD